MKRALLSAAVLLAIWPAEFSNAEMCTVDVVPAATLLVPYFEVDLNQTDGINTVISVHNALPQPVLAKVTLWTDYSIPSVWFDLFLTGYDVVRFDLGDAFHNGNLPITADLQSDGDDTISPSGDPSWDGSFPECENFFPFYVNPVLGAFHLERIRSGHTGQGISSLSGECIGSDPGDDIARGYITIDVVTHCSLVAPHEVGYFGGAEPVAADLNALWGEFSIYDPGNASSFTESLVHIEADPGFDASSTATGYTFYGRYTQADNGADHREPLGTVWGARYLNGGAFSAGTDLVVWRDSTSSVTPVSIPCQTFPDWYPLDETAVSCWNEQEDLVSLCELTQGGVGEINPACFPLETQRVGVGDGDLSPPWSFGWCSLDLNIPGDSFPGDVDFPSGGGDASQSYVMSISSATGLFGVGLGALQMGHACDDPNPELLELEGGLK